LKKCHKNRLKDDDIKTPYVSARAATLHSPV
jgi:hypothetical protein